MNIFTKSNNNCGFAPFPTDFERSIRLNLVVVHETGLTRPLYSLDRATLENVEVATCAALEFLRDDEGFYYYGERRDDAATDPHRRRLIVSREYCANGERWRRLLLNAFDRSTRTTNARIDAAAVAARSTECAITLFRETTVTVVSLRLLARTGRIVTTKYVREDVNLGLQVLNSHHRRNNDRNSVSSQKSTDSSTSTEIIDVVATNEFAKHTSCDNGCHDFPPQDEHANACVACLDCIWVDTLVETTYFDDDDNRDDNTTAKGSKISKNRRHEVLEVPRFFLYRESCYDRSHIVGCLAEQSCVTSPKFADNGPHPPPTIDYCPWHAWVGVHLTWLKRYIVEDWKTSFGAGGSVPVITRPAMSPLKLQTREAIWRDVRQNGFVTCGLYEVAFVEIVENSAQRDDYRRALLLFERDCFALLPLPAFLGDDSYKNEILGKFSNVTAHWIPRRFAYENVSSVTIRTANDNEREGSSDLSVCFAPPMTTSRSYENVWRVPSAKFLGKSEIRIRHAPTDRPFRRAVAAAGSSSSPRTDDYRESITLQNILTNLEYMCSWSKYLVRN